MVTTEMEVHSRGRLGFDLVSEKEVGNEAK